MSNRRSFLRNIVGVAALPASAATFARRRAALAPSAGDRQQTATLIRQNAATMQGSEPVAEHPNNGDEAAFPGYIANFTKGLPHSQIGEVQPGAYETLLQAISTGQSADFEDVACGSGMKLVDPQAAFAFEMEGGDSHRFGIPPAPAFSSADIAAEMVELYWQALLRDVPFDHYDSSPLAQSAIQDLSNLSAFHGPQSGGQITTGTLFRGNAAGALDGPYLSQFFWQPIPVHSSIVQQQFRVPLPAIDYLTTYSEWYASQTGVPPSRNPQFDSTPRYINTGRALAEWVHYDFLYEAFHNAALILLNQGPETILNKNPYLSPSNPYKNSTVQTGFSTFGAPHICCLLGHAAMSALHAAWFQKWAVHRRLRPEAFGGRVHQAKVGAAQYPLHADLMNSLALNAVHSTHGSYLLPQAFPEGCPLHPAYPAGHATVAGACSAMLKAFFDETAILSGCVVPTSDGTALVPYQGPPLLLGSEINKLACNVAMGRNFAGIHYRSDVDAGFRLGEDIAISMLQDMVNTLTQDFQGFQFTRIDGTPVQICKNCGV